MKNRKANTILYIFIILIIVIILGVLLYLFIFNNKDINIGKSNSSNNSNTNNSRNDDDLFTSSFNAIRTNTSSSPKETMISTFSTDILDNADGRLENIQITCEIINGYILEPRQNIFF